MTDAIQKYEHAKELARLRQKKYYESKKDAINAKRRETYRRGKQEQEQEQEREPENITMHFEEPEPEIENPEIKEISKELAKLYLEGNRKSLSPDEAETMLKLLPKNANTIKKYVADLKRLVKITECQNLIKCFKNFKPFIKKLTSYKQENGEPYSINNTKGMIQTILFLNTELKLNIPEKAVEAYKNLFEEYKYLSGEKTKENKESHPQKDLTFAEYLDQVKTKFGEFSKMNLISNLYNELTTRDDMGQILLVKSNLDTKDNTKNYIVLPNSGNGTILINQFKTQDKYIQLKNPLTPKTTKILREYVKINKIEYGKFLFNEKSLSSFISKSNKTLGIQGSTSLFRKLKVSDNESKPLKERVKLATKMGHSIQTADKVYNIKNKKKG